MKIQTLLVTASLCLFSSTCFAQGLPSPKEIDRRIKEGLATLPDTTAELEGVLKFTYKAIPSDPKAIAKLAGADQGLPPGMDIDAIAKQYGPMIQQKLNQHLQVAGTLEAFEEVKVKSKKISKGKHKFGFLFKGQSIAGMVIYVGKKKVLLKFKSKGVKTPAEALKIVVERDKKKTDRVHVGLAFLKQVSKSREYFKTSAAK
ncbi:MAG: hypothetical protein P1V97_03500 [Planctomycetota bacterium]|nr:hypothetical protein [Planctomycetota bacterium]